MAYLFSKWDACFTLILKNWEWKWRTNSHLFRSWKGRRIYSNNSLLLVLIASCLMMKSQSFLDLVRILDFKWKISWIYSIFWLSWFHADFLFNFWPLNNHFGLFFWILKFHNLGHLKCNKNIIDFFHNALSRNWNQSLNGRQS
jgi:hypothetical protein